MAQIGFVFIEGFADWEFGHLAGAAAEWFGGNAVALTPGAKPVVSFGGLSLDGHRGLSPAENEHLNAMAVIGSEAWYGADPPDIGPLLTAVSGRGGVVGGICAGTLTLARAGLFADRVHTSNGRDWIQELVPGYAGAEHYRDVPHAVADNRIISAPGSAPATFALDFLRALHPDKTLALDQMRQFMVREFQGAGESQGRRIVPLPSTSGIAFFPPEVARLLLRRSALEDLASVKLGVGGCRPEALVGGLAQWSR